MEFWNNYNILYQIYYIILQKRKIPIGSANLWVNNFSLHRWILNTVGQNVLPGSKFKVQLLSGPRSLASGPNCRICCKITEFPNILVAEFCMYSSFLQCIAEFCIFLNCFTTSMTDIWHTDACEKSSGSAVFLNIFWIFSWSILMELFQ